jgi:hypothetical protein
VIHKSWSTRVGETGRDRPRSALPERTITGLAGASRGSSLPRSARSRTSRLQAVVNHGVGPAVRHAAVARDTGSRRARGGRARSRRRLARSAPCDPRRRALPTVSKSRPPRWSSRSARPNRPAWASPPGSSPTQTFCWRASSTLRPDPTRALRPGRRSSWHSSPRSNTSHPDSGRRSCFATCSASTPRRSQTCSTAARSRSRAYSSVRERRSDNASHRPLSASELTR